MRIRCISVVLLLVWLTGCVSVAPTLPVGDARKPEAKKVSPAEREFAAAESLLRQGNLDKAEARFLAITERWPRYSSPWTNLGYLYRKTGRPEEALAAFEKAVSNNAADCVALMHLADIHSEQYQFDIAADALRQCVEQQPEYAAAWLHLGVVHELNLGDLPAALAAYERYQLVSDGADKQVGRWIADLNRRIQQSQALAGGVK